VQDIGFSHVHTFKYSVRKGTRAEKMPDQISEKIKKQRSEVVRKLAEENKRKYYSRFIGKKQRVLVEKVSRQGMAKGFGEYYLPIEFRSDRDGNNYFTDVLIKEIITTSQHNVLRGTGI
jgi:threonylcarbamoyladenosine tRNA methylthiotransferase MtaB